MEIAKLRLQLSTMLEQVKVRLWQVRFRLRKLRRIAAERARRLGQELRVRGSALRVLLAARSREGIVAANGKITKAKARVSMAFERGAVHLRHVQNKLGQVRNGLGQVRNRLGQAQNRLKGMTRSIAEKRQKRAEERRTRKNELRVQAAKYPKAVVEPEHKVTKTKAQLSIVPGQWTAHLLQAQDPLAGLARSIAEKGQKPPEELNAGEEGLRPLEARPLKAVVEADSKITRLKAQPPAAFEQSTPHLGQGSNPLSGLTSSIAEKPPKQPEEPRVRKDELRMLEATSREAAVEADRRITKVKAQLSAGFKQGTSRLRRARKTLAGLGRNITDKRQRGRQELGARESQMRELLDNSPDAIAVINGDHCFVTANRKALDLFGVSERNLGKFSIDVFLFRGQIADLQRNGSSFMGRQEKHGKCTIRRLDGSLRTAEFAFVTDFLPLQHLCRFYDLHMPRPTPIQHRIAPGTQDVSHAGQMR